MLIVREFDIARSDIHLCTYTCDWKNIWIIVDCPWFADFFDIIIYMKCYSSLCFSIKVTSHFASFIISHLLCLSFHLLPVSFDSRLHYTLFWIHITSICIFIHHIFVVAIHHALTFDACLQFICWLKLLYENTWCILCCLERFIFSHYNLVDLMHIERDV